MLLSSAATSKPEFLDRETHSFSRFGKSHAIKTLYVVPSASIFNGVLQLSSYPTATDSSGGAFLRKPFKLWQDHPNGTVLASFTASFLFTVSRFQNFAPGDGLAFLISPSPSIPASSHGQYLGLTNKFTDGNATNQLVAIELDTVKQEFDPDDNHIGLNINSVRSTVSVSLSQFGFQIVPKRGSQRYYVVWVEYDGVKKVIDVYMAKQRNQDAPIAKKPTKAVLSYSGLDLRRLVNQASYFGFSSSSGDGYESNVILKWNLSVEVIPELESNSTERQNAKNSSKIILGVSMGVPLLFLLVVGIISGVVYYLCKKTRVRTSDTRLLSTLKRLPGTPREFGFEELKKATSNFDDKNKLGQGGFGVVYKGILLKEKTEVAVKMFSRDSMKSIDDFLAELTIINRLRHKNLVRLIGN